MKIDIFKYKNYKRFLLDRIENDGKVTKGLKLKISESVGCQPSYLSQVLNGKPHLTLEQASRLNQFFCLNKAESKYFILLVELARAGTKGLRDFFEEQIEEQQHLRFSLKRRLEDIEEIPETERHRYYSAWFYSAIHVILSIKEFQEPQKIAEHFNLPLSLVIETINFLENIGLIVNENGTYKFTKKTIYLGKDSIFIQRHHINWRSQALQSVEKNLKDDFHYSNVLAISKSDFPKIKDILVKALEEANKVIVPSKEEAIYALTLDLFGL